MEGPITGDAGLQAVFVVSLALDSVCTCASSLPASLRHKLG